jgi:acyl carrier protein
MTRLSDSLAAEVFELVSDVMGVPVATVNAESSPETLAGWDSVKHLTLAVALEERFGIALTPEEIESITNVQELLTLVASKRT